MGKINMHGQDMQSKKKRAIAFVKNNPYLALALFLIFVGGAYALNDQTGFIGKAISFVGPGAGDTGGTDAGTGDSGADAGGDTGGQAGDSGSSAQGSEGASGDAGGDSGSSQAGDSGSGDGGGDSRSQRSGGGSPDPEEQVVCIKGDVTTRKQKMNVETNCDGTFDLVLSSKPLNYLSNGVFLPISNLLQEANTNGFEYKVDENVFDVLFEKNPTDDRLLQFKIGTRQINYSFFDTNSVTATLSGNSIIYTNMLDGGTVDYKISADSIKETITYNAYVTNEWYIKIVTTNTYATKDNNGNVNFYDSDTDALLWQFLTPFMEDADGVKQDLNATIVNTAEGFNLTLTGDANWMQNTAAYPLEVDPTTALPDASTGEGVVTIQGVVNPPSSVDNKFVTDNQTFSSTQVFAIDTALEFSKANVSIPKTSGAITHIIKCKDANFDYASGSCSEWEKTSIPFVDSGDNINFSVTSFSAYSGANLGSEPTTSNEFGEGTDLASVFDYNNVSNLNLATASGGIVWDTANISGLDLNTHINIGDNFISLNSGSLQNLNKSATITIKNVDCTSFNNIVYANGFHSNKDEITTGGIICDATTSPACTSISCSGSTLTFTASHFTGFSSTQGTDLSIYDVADTEFGGAGFINANTSTYYTASYNASGGAPITGATCNWEVTTEPKSGNMTFNSTDSTYYKVDAGISEPGLHSWNVSCEKSGDFAQNTVADTLFVLSADRSGGADATLTLLDQVDTGEAESSRIQPNTAFKVYAQYYNQSNSALIPNSTAAGTGGGCEVEFSSNGTVYGMTANGSEYYYIRESGIAFEGTHVWNVTCNHGYFDRLQKQNDFIISAVPLPEFGSIISMFLAISISLFGLFFVRRRHM